MYSYREIYEILKQFNTVVMFFLEAVICTLLCLLLGVGVFFVVSVTHCIVVLFHVRIRADLLLRNASFRTFIHFHQKHINVWNNAFKLVCVSVSEGKWVEEVMVFGGRESIEIWRKCPVYASGVECARVVATDSQSALPPDALSWTCLSHGRVRSVSTVRQNKTWLCVEAAHCVMPLFKCKPSLTLTKVFFH
jgi:hypothetical protein